jgi:RNA polymerase subunit RPABC4/transcription elongation factor Spt4
MNICQNCGQSNSQESNFCRFCGTQFEQMQKQNDYGVQMPRPYAWKTDEFQLEKQPPYQPNPRNTTHLPPNLPTVPQQQQYPAPPVRHPYGTNPDISIGHNQYHQQPQMPTQSYRCPRCFSQHFPRYEKKISTAGWVVFAVLLVTFFPLFWIGFLIKEDVRICPMCNLRVS